MRGLALLLELQHGQLVETHGFNPSVSVERCSAGKLHQVLISEGYEAFFLSICEKLDRR